MCRKFSAVQEHCPPKLFATRYSPFATVFHLGIRGLVGKVIKHYERR
ncbi:MAG: hypothetical protein ACO2PL_04130 [Armatimonadota bacterium]